MLPWTYEHHPQQLDKICNKNPNLNAPIHTVILVTENDDTLVYKKN